MFVRNVVQCSRMYVCMCVCMHLYIHMYMYPHALLPRKAKKRISDEIQMLKNLKHDKIITFINAWTNKEQEKARGGGARKKTTAVKSW